MIKINQPAPQFKLASTMGEISLKDYKGKYVVLFFYPLDFSSVCSTEIPELNRRLDEFEKLNSVLLGINTDSIYSHKEWAKSLGGIKFPLLSDYNKEVSKMYEVLLDDEGIALRGVFIIDPDGIVKHISINDTTIGRSVTEILRILAALQTKKACPVEWKPGDATL